MQINKVKFTVIGVAISISCLWFAANGVSKSTQGLPIYKVDPFWPKPLPNKWIMQGVPDLVVDKDDHIWVMNRPRDIMPDESGAATDPPRTDCCKAAPAVLEFDTEGNLIKGWGGPGYVPDWPAPGIERPGPGAEHGIVVDREGNVWISGNARGDSIQKFQATASFSGISVIAGPGRRRRKTGAFEAEQSGHKRLPGWNLLLRSG